MLEKKYYDGMQIHDVLYECLDDYDTILTILEKFASLPSAINADRKGASEMKWIPTSERLPSRDELYLVTYEWIGRSGTKYTEIEGIEFKRGRWECHDYETVTAWMPLPEPYRKDEPQLDCLTCRYISDEWDSPKCDGCSKAYSNYESSMVMSGVLTLTEESSNELFRVLEEQDKAYINDVLDGKCGFTIKSTDGRSVELVPTQNKRNQRVQSVEACDMRCIQTEAGCEQTDCPWR